MTSALLRRGGRQAPGISGCGVGGVGTRLAGYSRGGGAGSRRWMALTENRLLKQHDISWNESTHAHTHIRTNTHFFLAKLVRFHAHKLALHPSPRSVTSPSTRLSSTSHFRFPQSLSMTSAHSSLSVCFLFFFNPCFHLKSANVDGVGGVFHLRRQLLSNSLPSLSVFHPPSLQVPPLKPNTLNEL